MKIAIRVDGDCEIGMGHIMRCTAIADEFLKKGAETFFISSLDNGINYLDGKNYKTYKIDNGYRNDYNQIKEIYENRKFDILIIDSYNVSKDYFNKIYNYLQEVIICYIDDLNKFYYKVDCIINGNITGSIYNYEKEYKDDVLLLTGSKYCILRDEFRNLNKRNKNNEVKNVLVTSGGADSNNMCFEIVNQLAKIKEYRNLKFNILVGNLFENKKQLYKLESEYKNVNLYENHKKISELMVNSDIGISSGGSTIYELCVCGVPTIAFVTVNNQIDLVKEMNLKKYILSCGQFDKNFKQELLDKFSILYNNSEKRHKLSKRVTNYIDGKGVIRIVEKLKKLKKK